MRVKADFKHISELNWDPYTGKDYFKSNIRILIIGESHYEKGVDIEKYKNKNFTNHVVNNHAIKGLKHSKLFSNLHKALFAEQKFNRQKLWDNLAFYNFVQRSMDSNKKRPSKEDFVKGWLTFFQIVESLKPTHCLFVGVGASKWLKNVRPDEMIKKCDNKINNTFPRKVSLKINDNAPINVIFIKHSSQYFSWSIWNEFLQNEMKEELNWLKKIIHIPLKTPKL
tara:strand:- start:1628 stop:2302 length:675 start_codon:yes stop_codon:yes gene_type:complete